MDITTYIWMFGASAEAERPGQEMWTTPGTYSFVVPRKVTSISAVAIGGGGGGMHGQIYSGAEEIGGNYNAGLAGHGAGTRWIRAIAVTPGETLTVVVGAGGAASDYNAGNSRTIGGSTSILRGSTTLLVATGGGASVGAGTAFVSGEIGGGNGGLGGMNLTGVSDASGAGGAGGYTGNGGNGGYATSSNPFTASAGAGGAGGGGERAAIANPSNYDLRGGMGGGCGLMGAGAAGAAGSLTGNRDGGNGSNGAFGCGGAGGQAKTFGSAGYNGACRIIWGAGRAYPSTRTADE